MRHNPLFGALLFCIACLFALTGQVAHAQSAQPTVVISQVYGGGGNSGATYTHDFIELFNRGERPVLLAGWSVQYASANGANWQMTELTGTIQPGSYYLIQQAQGSGGTTSLPAPDAIGAIPLSASNGKVALLSTNGLLARGTACPDGPTLVDLVGFGSADCFAGAAAAPALDNKRAGLRAAAGCVNSGSNSADFSAVPPTPRNSASAPQACDNSQALLVTPVVSQKSETLTVTAPSVGPNRSSVSTGSIQTITRQTISGTTPSLLPHSETTATAMLPSVALSMTLSGPLRVVISQVYGGGGNAGANYTHDFVELYNAGTGAVDLDGWSLQYASATGKTWLVTLLSGSSAPGEFYLIQQAQGAGGSLALPVADALGITALSASSGKVALVRGVDALTGACPRAEMIVDFVGYGGADCFEGSGPGTKTSNTQALHRVGEGAQDTGDNRADFVTAPPMPHE